MVPISLLKRIIGGRTRRIIKKKIKVNVKGKCDHDKTHYRTQHPTKSKKSL